MFCFVSGSVACVSGDRRAKAINSVSPINIREICVQVGFEALRAVAMKSSIFYHVTPRSALKVDRRFGGTCDLHLHGRKISQTRNRTEGGSKQRLMQVSCVTYPFTLKMEATCCSETSAHLQRTT
jgi:hypothetical protein